jgi:adhesin/invasin
MWRTCAALALALPVATCRDGVGPGTPTRAQIAVAPILPSEAALADFGLTIDAVRFVVVRPAADTLADTTLALPPDSTELALDLRVSVVSVPETLQVSVVALSGTLPLFIGTRSVPVPSTVVTAIPVDSFIGPVADSIVIIPRAAFIALNDSLRFQVLGFNGGAPVTQFYIAWSSSDSSLAPINRFGVLRAPGARASVRVRARTPSGASDSVPVTFVPLATQLVPVPGAPQSGTAGQPLATPFEVEVRAADGLGVGGVAVRFRSLSGGAPADTTVTSDTLGRARATGVLGPITGAQSFEVVAAGLAGSTVMFNVTAFAGAATQLVTSAGDLQSAVVGTAVATDPAVRAEDQFGNPVPGASISFAVSGGGGSVAGPAQLTNGAGVATVGSWTLDTTAGTDTLTATLSGLTPVTFTATGIAGAATQIAQLAGDGQAAVVNTILPTAPAVIVRDQFNNPVPGVGVSFAPDSGGGSVTGASPLTDTTGVARVGSWRLGTLVGQNTLAASASGLAGSPVTFVANGTRDVAAQLLRVSIDTQTAIAGQAVSVLPTVRVADQYGNAVPGGSVTFTLTGALIGTVTPSVATTDSLGVGRVTNWTLATGPGVNTLDAAASGLAGSPITFSANGITTTAASMALDAGDLQSGIVATLLPIAYSVVVKDSAGLPVQNVQVHWVAGPAGGSMNPATSPTDVNGIAASTRTLGVGAGTQTATASVGGLAGSPVTFSATALADVPAQLVKLSVDPQSATVATLVAAPPSVRVVDRFGNPVSGVVVGFTVASGGGSVGASADTTDALGVAAVQSWTLGTIAGINNNSLQASAAGVPSVTFRASGIAGAPARLAFLVEPSRALAGDTITPPVEVTVQDQYGNIDFTATDLVQLGLGPVTPLGAKLLGATAVAAEGGVAVFPDLAIDSAGFGYTLVATSGTLAGAESKPFDVGGVIAAFTDDRLDPVAAAFNPVNGFVYVPGGDGETQTLGVLDPSKGLLSLLPILQSQPFGVAVNAQTNRVYVTTFAVLTGGVVVIDASDNSPIATILLDGEARGIAVDEGTDTIFVAVAGDPGKDIPPSLAIIDGKENRVVTSIPFKDGALAGIGVAFDPTDRLVYVAIPNLGVGVFDLAKREHVTTVPIVGDKGAAGTYGVAVDVRARLVYATNRAEHTFSVIDPVGRKELDRFSVGAFPEGLGIDPDRGVVYVANSGANTVSFIHQDPKTSRFVVFATLIVGPQPKAAAVDPTTGRFYVPTFTDDQVRVVQP